MKILIEGQTIRIDDHRRGNVPHDWNDATSEIHIHKKCNKKNREYDIIIPLNHDAPARIISENQDVEIPKKLEKEIKNAFSNPQTRNEFLQDIYRRLEDYNWNRCPKEELKIANRIANVFGIQALSVIHTENLFVQFYEDKNNVKYCFVINYAQRFASIGERTLGLMRGIHSAPKSQWLEIIDENLPRILEIEYYADRVRFIEDLAAGIKGIGEVITDETIANIEYTYFNRFI